MESRTKVPNLSAWLPLFLSSLVTADVITGTITDAANGSPLSGVEIRLQGSPATATSDAYGGYSINTAGSSIGVPQPNGRGENAFHWNRNDGDFTVDVRSFNGRRLEHYDSRKSGPNQEFVLRPTQRGIQFVSVKTERGTFVYRVHSITATKSVVDPVRSPGASPGGAAFRQFDLNNLKYTKAGYEVSMKQIDGSGKVDLAMVRDSNLLENGNFLTGTLGWEVDQIRPASARVSVIDDGPDSGSGKALKVNIRSIDSTSKYGWQVQAYHPVAIEAEKHYTLSYWIKSDSVMSIPVVVMQNHDPYEHHTVEMTIVVTPNWTRYELEFDMATSDPEMRVNFGNMAQIVGQNFYLAEVKLTSSDAPSIVPLVTPAQH